MSRRTIALTGAGGYLGTVLTKRLLDAGHRLSLHDDGRYGVQGILAATAGYQEGRDFRVRIGDICDPDRLDFDGVEVIVHLAAIVGYPACDADPQEAWRVNVEGTRVVCAVGAGMYRPVILASTGSTYGAIPEGQTATEDLPISPLTCYGRTKAAAEEIVRALDGTCLRFATLFGPSFRMRWDQLPHDFVWQAEQGQDLAVYEPDAWRPFLHVRDAANLIAHLIHHPPRGAAINVGRPALQITKGQLADRVIAAVADPLAAWLAVPGSDVERRTYQVDYRWVQRVAPDWAAQQQVELGLEYGLEQVAYWARRWQRAERRGR